MKTINNHIFTKDIYDVLVIDNFFTNECLEILKDKMLRSKINVRFNNYNSINFTDTDYLTRKIVEDLKEQVELPRFQRGWSFVYDNQGKGAQLHCDPSIINLNIWLSSNDSVDNTSQNGLNIYKIKPPTGWSRNEWNSTSQQSLKKCFNYIKENNIKPMKIKYKSNRAVFFNGAYFHETNKVSMKGGVDNKRISYTLLFGENLEQASE